MKVAIALFYIGICMVVGAPEKTFPCDFNLYDKTKDGKITRAEFFKYTDIHGYNAEHSSIVFRTLDSNADGQIEVSEFVANAPILRKLSLIERCTRGSFIIKITWNLASAGPLQSAMNSNNLQGPEILQNGLQNPEMIGSSSLLQNQLG